MPADPRTLLERYQRWRTPFEIGAVVAIVGVNLAFNVQVVTLTLQRMGQRFAPWEPFTWEATSSAMWLVLIPAIVAFEHRVPLHFGVLRRNLPWHLAASIVVSILHVAGMFGMRAVIYSMRGARYDPGDLPREFLYEYLKDVRTYAFVLAIVLLYRLILLRLQGEARLLEAPDAGRAVESIDRPERFLVRKLGKEFLLPAGEIESLQAMGNYVNLRVRGRDYPLRSTMAAIEARLDPARFVRVHRSYIVNLDSIAEIEPTDGGDARIRLKGGHAVPCSRKYRDAVRAKAAR
jgi:hypothetical protein